MINLLIKLGYTPSDYVEMSLRDEKVEKFLEEAALMVSLQIQERINNASKADENLQDKQ